MEKFKFSSQLDGYPFMCFFQIDLINIEKLEPCVVGRQHGDWWREVTGST